MAYTALLGPSAGRAAGFPVRALEDLSPGEQRLGMRDELELETVGGTLAERPEGEPDLEAAPRTVWDVVQEIAETGLVKFME